VDRHLVEVLGGLDSLWLCKSLMYSRISVRVHWAAAKSPSIALYRIQRAREGDICCRCRYYSLSLVVGRVLDVGSIAEVGRVVVFPDDVCGQEEGSRLGRMSSTVSLHGLRFGLLVGRCQV
jgi:hypothetical protein